MNIEPHDHHIFYKREEENAAAIDRAEQEDDDQMSEEELAEMRYQRALYEAQKPKNKCDDCGEPCESWLCQECCPHEEHDHGYCIECGANIMDDLVGRAEMARDAAEDR